jgi:hypothetical protein
MKTFYEKQIGIASCYSYGFGFGLCAVEYLSTKAGRDADLPPADSRWSYDTRCL